MSEKILGYFSKRFAVEVGQNEYIGAIATATRWSFERAYNLESDAIAYAERIAQDREHVRVVDRGEVVSDDS